MHHVLRQREKSTSQHFQHHNSHNNSHPQMMQQTHVPIAQPQQQQQQQQQDSTIGNLLSAPPLVVSCERNLSLSDVAKLKRQAALSLLRSSLSLAFPQLYVKKENIKREKLTSANGSSAKRDRAEEDTSPSSPSFSDVIQFNSNAGVAGVGGVSNHLYTVTELLDQVQSISTGSTELDSLLLGGIPCGMVTEIAGPPGSGKSVVAQHLAAVCVAEQTQGSVLFVDADSKLNLRNIEAGVRQRVTSDHILLHHNGNSRAATSSKDLFAIEQRLQDCMSRVHVTENILTFDDMLQRHHRSQLEVFVILHKVKLLVIDSFTLLLKVSHPDPTAERHAQLLEALQFLKQLAESAAIAVVITNHAASMPSTSSSSTTSSCVGGLVSAIDPTTTTTSSSTTTAAAAALGNSFHHAVNIRITVQQQQQQQQFQSFAESATSFLLRVIKSPLSPPMSVTLSVSSSSGRHTHPHYFSGLVGGDSVAKGGDKDVGCRRGLVEFGRVKVYAAMDEEEDEER